MLVVKKKKKRSNLNVYQGTPRLKGNKRIRKKGGGGGFKLFSIECLVNCELKRFNRKEEGKDDGLLTSDEPVNATVGY